MKTKFLKIPIYFICIVAIWFTYTGFQINPTVSITDYSVNDEETIMTFTISNVSSMGYIRAYKDEGGGKKPHYLKFYCAWGGMNSSLGAKSEYTLELEPDDNEIYVYHGNGTYDLVLQKDPETGEWNFSK